MLETRAIVVDVRGKHALVQSAQGSGCEQCNGKGCGASKLSRIFCSKPRQYRVENPVEAKIDDEVVISVAEGAILHGAGTVYLLPLFLLLIGAIMGNQWDLRVGQGDTYAALGALSGLIAGFFLARMISRNKVGKEFQPCITRIWNDDKNTAMQGSLDN